MLARVNPKNIQIYVPILEIRTMDLIQLCTHISVVLSLLLEGPSRKNIRCGGRVEELEFNF